MASGDRIELLTAGTFETAMNSVAQESTSQTINTNVNTANTNINTIKSTTSVINTNTSTIQSSVGSASAAPSVTSAGGVVNTANTVQQKLQGISQYQIGATNSTGGSATAGNVMAKLNSIISTVNNIQSSTDNSLNSTVFVPSETNLLKTILNTPTTVNTLVCVGTFVAKYSGTICIKATGYSVSDASSHYGRINAYANMSNAGVTLYPTMPQTNLSESSSINSDSSTFIAFRTLTSATSTSYLQVRAGDIVYIVLRGYSDSACICSNISIYGTATSYY